MRVYPQREDGRYWLEVPTEWWRPYAGEEGLEIPRWKWFLYRIAMRVAYWAETFARNCARKAG